VTFRRCAFLDNNYFGLPAQPALIVGNGVQNRLDIIECNFERNDMSTGNTIVSSKLLFSGVNIRLRN